MRLLCSVGLLVVAVVAGLFAWGALQNLWSDYRDSSTSTYLMIGIPSLLLGLAALYASVQLWRGAKG